MNGSPMVDRKPSRSVGCRVGTVQRAVPNKLCTMTVRLN